MVRRVPADFPLPAVTWRGIKPTAIHEYRNPDGSLSYVILRFDSDGSKQFAPFTLWQTPDGRMNWCCAAPSEPGPLYRLPQLLEAPDMPVLLTISESAADAAAGFESYVSVTWAGGWKAMTKADFSPLSGRKVT